MGSLDRDARISQRGTRSKMVKSHCTISNALHSVTVGTPVRDAYIFPRCIECQRGLAMRKVSVCLSVRLSVCQTHALWQSINQSINQFIRRHSTEARATVRLCRIKEKCLKTDLTCVNGWSSSVEESSGSKICLDFYTIERTFSLVFWEEEWLVGCDPFYLKFGATGPRWSEIGDSEPIFARSASAVTPSEKNLININRKSITRFPMSLRCITPQRGLKNATRPFSV